MKGLTSHVLDTLNGVPARGVRVALYKVGSTPDNHASPNRLLNQQITDEQGRCVLADELPVGVYELRFSIGGYFAQWAVKLADPPFLDEVSVRFSIASSDRHYHIPLVASPWSYTTYKGGAPKLPHH